MVAGDEKLSLARVPDRKDPVTEESVDALFAPAVIGLEEETAIRDGGPILMRYR
jgi:hypothetical protein